MTAPIRAHDDLFIICAAFRYAIGRKSYAPGLVADWIEKRKAALTDELCEQIAREIREEVSRHVRVHKDTLAYEDRWLALADSLEGHLIQKEDGK